jgi:hypothetical protein
MKPYRTPSVRPGCSCGLCRSPRPKRIPRQQLKREAIGDEVIGLAPPEDDTDFVFGCCEMCRNDENAAAGLEDA